MDRISIHDAVFVRYLLVPRLRHVKIEYDKPALVPKGNHGEDPFLTSFLAVYSLFSATYPLIGSCCGIFAPPFFAISAIRQPCGGEVEKLKGLGGKRVRPFYIRLTVYAVSAFIPEHPSPCAEACSAATATLASWAEPTGSDLIATVNCHSSFSLS